MIAFIKGKLHKKAINSIIVEAGGIGYFINVAANSFASLGAPGDDIMIHTYMKASDDGISLFGFMSEEELRMFNFLLNVNGIGPKNALAILSSLSPDAIIMAVLSEDISSLSKAQGIGKKTAQRMVLDLKDKFKAEDLLPTGTTPQQTLEFSGTAINEAIDALISLGYSQSESTRAVMAVSEDGLSSNQLIKLALKKLASV